MSWNVSIAEVHTVYDHPNSDKLSIICILDSLFSSNIIQVVSSKLEDGSHRYKGWKSYFIDDKEIIENGELVVFVPDRSIVPDYLLKQGFWDEEKNKGCLAGPNGNRVKASNFKGVRSEGILFPARWTDSSGTHEHIKNEQENILEVFHGDNVADFLGITEWESK